MVRRFEMVVLWAGWILSSMAFAQTAQVPPAVPAPAPRHDISGTWAPANGPGDGIQAGGVKAMPNDGKPA